jgi:hypothetical protein
MNRKKSFELNESLVDKIISVAYNDASLGDRLFVFSLIWRDKEARSIYESYKQSAEEVHKITEEECPQSVLRSVHLQTKVSLKTKSSLVNDFYYFMNDFYYIVFSRPLASAFLVLILVGAIIFGILNQHEVPAQRTYSRTEIQIAEKQTRQALAIVGKIFNETSHTLKDEVIKSRVAKPIQESVGIVNSLFNKGEIQ